MNIQYLIQMLQNKMTMLNNAKSQAFAVGDINQVNAIDQDLLETQNTFAQLAMLQDISAAAANINTTPAEVVASGIQASQNQTQGPSASAFINGYDISAYATDALHETKIQSIVNAMPAFSSADDIDRYIQNLAPTSPVAGDMVIRSATMYTVDVPLLIAIMQNDSAFGTLGVAARTFNPGNVGNTGIEERTYASWQDGVTAVAEWLNRHRISGVALDPLIIPIAEPTPQPIIETPVVTPTPPAPEPTPITTPEPLPPVEPPVDTATTTPPIIDEPVATTTPELIPETSTTTTEILETATSTTSEATTTEPTL